MPERACRDPICGKELSLADAAPSCVHDGETWYFCSRLCQIVFEAFPDRCVEIARQQASPDCCISNTGRTKSNTPDG